MSEKNSMGTDVLYAPKNGVVNYWGNKERLRKFFLDKYNLTEFHFQIFCAFGYSLNANPYAGEIIPIVFSKGTPKEKLSFILTRDFRGRVAQEQSDYETHFAVDVCANDKFRMNVEKGYPDHEFDETEDRGELKGAYCVVWKKNIKRPAAYVFVKYTQYKKSGPGAEIWEKIPNDMIIKVAEAHGLRQAYYNKFGNTYDSTEIVHAKGVVIDTPPIEKKPGFPHPPEPKQEKKEKKSKGNGKGKSPEQKNQNLFNEDTDELPPTKKDVEEMIDKVNAELGSHADVFWNRLGITDTKQIKTWTQIDGINAALDEEMSE
jgi:hypothetical protein